MTVVEWGEGLAESMSEDRLVLRLTRLPAPDESHGAGSARRGRRAGRGRRSTHGHPPGDRGSLVGRCPPAHRAALPQLHDDIRRRRRRRVAGMTTDLDLVLAIDTAGPTTVAGLARHGRDPGPLHPYRPTSPRRGARSRHCRDVRRRRARSIRAHVRRRRGRSGSLHGAPGRDRDRHRARRRPRYPGRGRLQPRCGVARPRSRSVRGRRRGSTPRCARGRAGHLRRATARAVLGPVRRAGRPHAAARRSRSRPSSPPRAQSPAGARSCTRPSSRTRSHRSSPTAACSRPPRAWAASSAGTSGRSTSVVRTRSCPLRASPP